MSATYSPRRGPVFFTNYLLVLAAIHDNPRARLKDIGRTVDITERAAHRLINELEHHGYLERAREGRRNVHTINPKLVGQLDALNGLLEGHLRPPKPPDPELDPAPAETGGTPQNGSRAPTDTLTPDVGETPGA